MSSSSESRGIPAPFSYALTEDRIAQRPIHPEHNARLLTLDRSTGKCTESTFWNIDEWLRAGDVLVLNDTRVLPSRFFAENEKTGAQVEFLLTEEQSDGSWKALGKPMKRLRDGEHFRIGQSNISAEVSQRDEGMFLSFRDTETGIPADREDLFLLGTMPIPPYIRGGKSDDQDKEDYQTVFAKEEGSIAAPTASLHFTEELLEKLQKKGVEILYVTLHVGTASFLPLWTDDAINEPPKHPGLEYFVYQRDFVRKLEERRSEGKRICAVGTTVVRALESFANLERTGSDSQRDGALVGTEIFITPGHEFALVDVLITNFHQPRTTHMLLVEALLGREMLQRSYDYALTHDFRLLSYGDGMIIL